MADYAIERAKKAEEVLRAASNPAPQAPAPKLSAWTPVAETQMPWDIERVCADIALGRSIRDIAQDMGVHPGTLALWLNDEERRDKYLSAMIVNAQVRATEIVGISDDENIDPAQKKIMVDSRWKLAQSLVPELYAQKQQQNKQIAVALVTFRQEDDGRVITVPVEEIGNADTDDNS
ncbi:MAG: hypothetical protein IRZ03_13580 [Acidobacterium ailaaui]|nr:hypothetical protein [Pseudacidobacterium ailaaui]